MLWDSIVSAGEENDAFIDTAWSAYSGGMPPNLLSFVTPTYSRPCIHRIFGDKFDNSTTDGR